MRTIRALVIRFLAVGVLALAASGCCGSISSTAAQRIDNLWKALGPRHREYIEKDPTLADPTTKAIRLETVDRMDAAVKDAVEASK